MKKLFLAILFSTSVLAFSQTKYTKEYFAKGLPGQIRFKWEKAAYAKIDIGDFYKNLILICKDTNTFTNSMYYALINKYGGLTLSALQFKQIKSGEYSATLEIKTTAEDLLSSLNIKLYPGEKEVEYIWGDSSEGYSIKPKIVKEYSLKLGKTFPSISVESSSSIVNLNDYRGKIIVINWWATSCVPCVGEIPGLNKLVKKYKNKPVIFLAIVYKKGNLESFLKDHPFDYKQCYGNRKMENLFGGTFPRNIIIDKNRKIIFNELGAIPNTWKKLDKIINKNL
jgi:thiol-disulfide isomerase/thioredoxin